MSQIQHLGLITKYLTNLKNLVLKNQPISIKLETKHPLVMRVQVCSNEGPHPFSSGDNYEIANIHWLKLKIFSRTTWPISTKLGTMHPWVKGIQDCSNKEPLNSHKVDNGFFYSLNQHYDMFLDLNSRMTDVAHGHPAMSGYQ